MPHKYDAIHGWFGWEEFYADFVNSARPNAQMVEVGVWLGKSLCYLAELCEERGRQDITLFGIDTWLGCEQCQDERIVALEGDEDELFEIAKENLDFPNVQLFRVNSLEGAALFDPGTLDLVFLDGNHRYNAVKADIIAWLPKVKDGGTLAGHDIVSWPSVKKAVKELLPYKREGDVWIHNR